MKGLSPRRGCRGGWSSVENPAPNTLRPAFWAKGHLVSESGLRPRSPMVSEWVQLGERVTGGAGSPGVL